MKHLEKLGVSEMKAKEQRKVNGGEIQPDGSCILFPPEEFPFPLGPVVPTTNKE